MDFIFEVIDLSGKKIHLSKEQWIHINEEHPEISAFLEDMKEILVKPDKYIQPEYDESIRYFYKYYKNRKSKAKYLLVLVKYLNGKGFIITSYFTRNIK